MPELDLFEHCQFITSEESSAQIYLYCAVHYGIGGYIKSCTPLFRLDRGIEPWCATSVQYLNLVIKVLSDQQRELLK